jgi:hypothetical protein
MHPVGPPNDPDAPEAETPEPSGTPMHPSDAIDPVATTEQVALVEDQVTLTTATPMHPIEAPPAPSAVPGEDTTVATSPMHPVEAAPVAVTPLTAATSVMHPAASAPEESTGSSVAHPGQ